MSASAVLSYAEALYAAAKENNAVSEVSKDMELLGLCLKDGSEEFRTLISPVIEKTIRMFVVRKAFEGRVHFITFNFIMVLVRRSRHGLLPELPGVFMSIIDKSKQCIRGHVTSARPLDSVEQQELMNRIRARCQRQCECDFAVDASLCSGFRIVIGDSLIDCSVSGSLARLRRLMLDTDK